MHLTEPEQEKVAQETDCDFCRQYWHYSFTGQNEELHGKPVRDSAGALHPWPENASPDCEHCPKRRAWTDENRALMDLVNAWQATNGNEHLLCAWGWSAEDWQSERFRDALLIVPAERNRIEHDLAQLRFFEAFGKAKRHGKT